jgi:arginyl-tRNA synthetase
MDAPRPTEVKTHCARLIGEALAVAWPDAPPASVVLERPKDAQHGDFACNVAMQLARGLKRPPREIAAAIRAHLPHASYLEKVEIAGAGFLNLFVRPAVKQRVVNEVIEAGTRYGRQELGQRKKVQVEFVSANPTGPLHVGHGRGAAYGSSLANILEAAGFSVSREYYVNDAGRQMDILALSTWLRYLQLSGAQVPFPANAYRGDYVRVMARTLLEREGTRYVRPLTDSAHTMPDSVSDPEAHLDDLIATARRLLGPDYEHIHAHALQAQLADCRADLAEFGVTFDEWFSEHSLYTTGAVERALERLAARGHVYEMDGARWFRSSAFGDEKDRVLRRENGQYTYFASDVAYHLNKFERGYDLAIDVWGADHHGYIARVKGALEALGLNREQLVIALVQFAVLYRGGQKVSMSTRAGEFVTLRELREEVGNDAARFFYVLRKSDQHLDFDLDLAKSQSNDNPVYYVQYAHARVCSLHEQWGGDPRPLAHADTSHLALDQELALLDRLIAYPEAVEAAARDFAPHLIAFYLRDLAGEFHSYYNATRILASEEPVKLARVALATAVREVVRNGLALLGVSAPERM